MNIRRWTAGILELLSVGLVVLAIAASLLLGGTSIASRSLVQLAACLSLLAAVGGMLIAGRFRLVPTWYWVFPVALVGFGLLQFLATIVWLQGGNAVPTKTEWFTGWTANPLATAHWVLWGSAVTILSFVTAHQLRGEVRTDAFFAIVAVLLTTAVLFAAISARDPSKSPQVAEAFEIDVGSSFGLAAYSTWQQVVFADGETDGDSWFARDASGVEANRQLLAMQLGACAVALVPILALIAVQRIGRAYLIDGRYWMTTGQGIFGGALGLFALLLSAIVSIHTASLTIGLGLVTAIAVTMILHQMRQSYRWIWLAGMMAPLLLIPVLQVYRSGGVSGAWVNVTQGISDNLSLLSLFGSHCLTGCGLGAVGDVWAWYRSEVASVGPATSSLLTFCCEGGLVATALLAGGSYVLLSQVVRYRSMLQTPQPSVNAYVGSFVGLLIVGILGPGLEGPSSLLLAAVIVGQLVRVTHGPTEQRNGGALP